MKNVMKRFSMGIAALAIILPTPFLIKDGSFNLNMIMLIFVMISWALLELYIGVSRPCEDTNPSNISVKIFRMMWFLFIFFSWLDIYHHWTMYSFPIWFNLLLFSFCVFGLFIRIWALIQLGKSFTYDVKRPQSGILITTGPYKFIRHPSYLSICILGSLPGLMLGSIIGFVGMLSTTLTLVVMRITTEEDLLEKEFGRQFMAYRRNTYRLLPFIY